MVRGAIISDCKQYRYKLWRVWDETKPLVGFIGLNPSTADGAVDDPTIKKLIGYAFRWRYGGFYIGNLFAFRATDPKVMMKAPEPIGPLNDDSLREISDLCNGNLVAMWGTKGTHLNRDKEVMPMFPELKCFCKTSDGAPGHPLYLPSDLKPIPFV